MAYIALSARLTLKFCDFQLSKERGTFGDKVFALKLRCYHGQLAQFLVVTCLSFSSNKAREMRRGELWSLGWVQWFEQQNGVLNES